ncbi:hypothetical protein NBRC116592_22630 [Colwellia sp. KU-HH00111]
MMTNKMTDNSPSFRRTLKSTFAAFFGVQSNKNREKDFSQGKLSHFILAGILAVVLFISTLILLVFLIVPN